MTIFVLLDAFRWDYLSGSVTPFLYTLAQRGLHVQQIRPSLSFCERSEIFCGAPPSVTGNFSAIGFSPENSPYHAMRGARMLEIVGNVLSCSGRLSRLFHHEVGEFLRTTIGKGMPAYRIPFSWLKYFSLTEDEVDHREPHAFRVPSLFGWMTENNKKYFYDSFTSISAPTNKSDTDRMTLVLENAGKGYDLYLLYISLPDYLGHEYGPESPSTKEGIRLLDQQIQEFVERFRRLNPSAGFVFLGDHGMSTVRSIFDAEGRILQLAHSLKLNAGKDFLYFLDSTMVRLWFFSSDAEARLSQVIRNDAHFLREGNFVNQEFANRHEIPWGDRRYGDMMWTANVGVLVFPDFFKRDRPYKGMHGYDPFNDESLGMCIVEGPGVKEQTLRMLSLAGINRILISCLNDHSHF